MTYHNNYKASAPQAVRYCNDALLRKELARLDHLGALGLDAGRNKISIFTILTASLLLLSAVFAFGQTTADQNLPEGVTSAQIQGALNDLTMVYGQTVSSVAQAKEICNSEKFLSECAEIGKKHNLYEADEVKQVDVLLTELKGKVVEDLKNCADETCLLNVATRMAKNIVAKNPTLAKNLDLTQEKIQEKQGIINVAKEAGVSLRDCQSMDPDTASVDLLRACAKIAKDSRVQRVISDEQKLAVKSLDYALSLKEALAKGQYQCGDGTLEGCGNFCLNPSAEARTQGVAAIPQVCRDIAAKFFGPDGAKELESAYGQVNQIKTFYAQKAENVIFTTADGRTITDPLQVGRYLEEEGKKGNVEAVSKGMDFMISRGFINAQDKEFALKMVSKVKEKGGIPDFNTCRQNPQACQEFIPEEFRGQFDAMAQIEEIMRQEIGFNPMECEKAGPANPSVGQKCLEGSKRGIAKIEALRLEQKSTEARFIIDDIKRHIQRGEEFERRGDEFRRVFESQGGPGGCKSENECRTYCSNPANGPECISFGSKNRISGFEGEEAIQRFQQFNSSLQAPQFGPPQFGPSPGGGFPGQGPFPGFIPPGQGGFPPGQYPGFTAPGPGFGPSPGFWGYPGGGYPGQPGPSPECFAAIQSGDFARAKETCQVNVPRPQIVLPGPGSQPAPGTTPICPSLSTVDQCPVGQIRVPTYSSPECGTYYACQPAGIPAPGPGPYPGPYPYPGPVPPQCSSDLIALLGEGCHQMYTDSSGNQVYCDGPMSKSAKRGDTAAQPGCQSGGGYPPGPSQPPTGQREQIWNSLGLRSWVRADADQTRIESLKQACANTSSGSNVWMPGAGDYNSPDFGMPDPAKCSAAQNCPTGQYWNGNSCVSSGTQPPGGGGQSVCDSSLIALLGQGCHQMYSDSSGNQVYCDGPMSKSAKRGDASAQPGCQSPGGTYPAPYPTSTYPTPVPPTSCPSGQYWNGTACVASTATTCPSGQYWNGTACVSSTTPPPPTSSSCPSFAHEMAGYCMLNNDTSRCAEYSSAGSEGNYTSAACQARSGATSGATGCPTGQYWNGTACVSSTSATPASSCPSGQYWSGTACVTSGGTPSPSTSCSSGQYWNGTACVSSASPSPSTSCSSGQYWNGTACVSSTSPSPSPSPSPSTSCPSGQYWNGTACVTSDSGTYTPPPSGTTPLPTGAFINPAHLKAEVSTFFNRVNAFGSSILQFFRR